jgi:6-methylsalicylate decarboxylase
LHLERLASRRGKPWGPLSDRLFYETSSYGPRALRAMAHWVGTDQLVYGSDRPMAKPVPSRFPSKRVEAMRRRNPGRLFAEAVQAA